MVVPSYDLCVIDAKNLAYRVEWTHRNLVDLTGRKTGMLFGTIMSLASLRKTYKIKKFVFLWDSLTNWRVDKYSWYKGGRVEKPEQGFIDQLNILQKEFLPALGIMQVEADDFEADDLAFWVADKWQGNKLFVTNDHDWLQLVRKNAHLLRPCKKEILDEDKVIESEGLSPSKLPLFWSFIGDDSDQIKGIFRVRKLWVKSFISDCSSIEEVLQKMNSSKECENSWSKTVERNYDIICLGKKLIENIKCYRFFTDFSFFKKSCEKYSMQSLVGKFGSFL